MLLQFAFFSILQFTAFQDVRYRLAIVDFEDASSYEDITKIKENRHLRVLMENLANTMQAEFNLVEREKVALIFEEQNLVDKNKVDPATAAKLGRMTGAEYLLTGVVTEVHKETRTFSGYGAKNVSNTICSMAVTFRLLHTSTGEVFAVGESFAEKKYRRKPSLDSYTRDLTKMLAEDILDQANKHFKVYRDRKKQAK